MLAKDKKIHVIGLGHIGIPILSHYLDNGYDVVGCDSSLEKIKNLKKGIVPIIEEGLENIIENPEIYHNEIPYQDNSIFLIAINIEEKKGVYDIYNLKKLINKIDANSKNSCIIIRSTISSKCIDELKDLEKDCSNTLCFSPEFMREGKAKKDLQKGLDYFGVIRSGSKPVNDFILADKFYDPKLLTILKVSNNSWRATKISFSNLLMMILEKESLNTDDFYELFIKDELNTGKAYLKPGAPYGGYCLPKETKILSSYEDETNFFNNVIKINEATKEFWLKKILAYHPKSVVFETFSFKTNTNDHRASPFIFFKDELEKSEINVCSASDAGSDEVFDLFIRVTTKQHAFKFSFESELLIEGL